jgi:DNA-binding transcriptional ArsR family regulator
MNKGRGLTELEDLERVFKALAHATRRHILIVLNARGGSMTAGEIANRFSCTWPTTTRHLRILESAGLVRVEKQGREWIYVMDAARLEKIAGGWLKWFRAESGERRKK